MVIRSEKPLWSMKAMSKTRKPSSPQAAYRYSPRACTCRISRFRERVLKLVGDVAAGMIVGQIAAAAIFQMLLETSGKASECSVLPMTACGSSLLGDDDGVQAAARRPRPSSSGP